MIRRTAGEKMIAPKINPSESMILAGSGSSLAFLFLLGFEFLKGISHFLSVFYGG